MTRVSLAETPDTGHMAEHSTGCVHKGVSGMSLTFESGN